MTYDKQCWFCGKRAMVPKGNYFQCSECGATWNDLPAPGFFIDIEPKHDQATKGTSYSPVRKSRRQIAKRR